MPAPGVLGARRAELDRLRRLARRSTDRQAARAFVAEGPKVVGDALAAGAPVEVVYVAEGATGLDDLRDRATAADVAVRSVPPRLLDQAAATVTPQGVLAVVDALDVPLADIAGATFVVVCVGIQDPGNAGTILRSAEAAGADAVVFTGGSVDPYNPKAVRASAGALFHVPVVCEPDPRAVLDALGGGGLTRWGTAATAESSMESAELASPVALVLGNEANGLPADVAGLLDGVLRIPMVGRSESLNVGMAAAVLCFEVARQRRAGGSQ